MRPNRRNLKSHYDFLPTQCGHGDSLPVFASSRASSQTKTNPASLKGMVALRFLPPAARVPPPPAPATAAIPDSHKPPARCPRRTLLPLHPQSPTPRTPAHPPLPPTAANTSAPFSRSVHSPTSPILPATRAIRHPGPHPPATCPYVSRTQGATDTIPRRHRPPVASMLEARAAPLSVATPWRKDQPPSPHLPAPYAPRVPAAGNTAAAACSLQFPDGASLGRHSGASSPSGWLPFDSTKRAENRTSMRHALAPLHPPNPPPSSLGSLANRPLRLGRIPRRLRGTLPSRHGPPCSQKPSNTSRTSSAAATLPPASPDSSVPTAATSTCSSSPANPATSAPPATNAAPCTLGAVAGLHVAGLPRLPPTPHPAHRRMDRQLRLPPRPSPPVRL